MQGLGRKQKKLLHDMRVYGGGYWMPEWFIGSETRKVLDSLLERGEITHTVIRRGKTAHRTYRIAT